MGDAKNHRQSLYYIRRHLQYNFRVGPKIVFCQLPATDFTSTLLTWAAEALVALKPSAHTPSPTTPKVVITLVSFILLLHIFKFH